MSDYLGRALVAQYVDGKRPRQMSFQLFNASIRDYRPADDPGRALRAASRAITAALAKDRGRGFRAGAELIAQGLRQEQVDPRVAMALTALEDYIGDDRKASIASWIGLMVTRPLGGPS